LVVGGSLGARKLNETIIDLLDWFKESRIQVLHVVGNRDYHSFRTCIDQSKYPLYRMLAYEDEMGKALRFADLVISRAGATAISEILALGKPSILIPYPFAADDHQTYNARILEDAGAAVAIPDRELTPSLLRTKISALYSNETILSKMSLSARGLAQLDAAIKIVNLAESLK
jgi:UDP-N-acetylglucosamine--N-acetylmuramyl-(pentapeptide) pyrophosphoryl-undecaprenol N-acetylglucosamine transferase